MEAQEEKKEEFKSDNINVTVNEKEACRVEYKVKVGIDLTKQSHKKAVKSVTKEVSIPGFRKGRAPENLIEKKFAEPIDTRWQKGLADLAFKESQRLTNIPVLSGDTTITFNMEKHSLEEGAEMTFSFEREPKVPEIEYEKVEFTDEERITIDDAKVNETIDQIQKYFATWDDITDRPAQEKDYLSLDIDLIKEDKTESVYQNMRFEFSEKGMSKWMRDLCSGMNIGESKDGISKPDDDASEKEKKEFEEKPVRITLKGIQVAKMPPVDDELAKKVGVPNAAVLKEKLTDLLNKQADEQVQKKRRDQVCDSLVTLYPFDLPNSMVEKEVQVRLKQALSSPEAQKEWQNKNEEERKKDIDSIKEHSEKALRLFYLCRSIISKENLKISPSDVNKEVNTPLDAMFSTGADYYTPENASQEQKALATSRLMLAKAQDFIISKKLGA